MAHPNLGMTGPRDVDGKQKLRRYTSDEIKEWIIGKARMTKSELKKRGSNISGCITNFQTGKGKACTYKAPGAQNSHVIQYRGKPVYHTSNGKNGTGESVTLFYTNPQGSDIKIIGIGGHVPGASDKYDIEWKVNDWGVGKTVVLS